MLSALPFLQTDPGGKPEADVGIFLIDKLFTNII